MNGKKKAWIWKGKEGYMGRFKETGTGEMTSLYYNLRHKRNNQNISNTYVIVDVACIWVCGHTHLGVLMQRSEKEVRGLSLPLFTASFTDQEVKSQLGSLARELLKFICLQPSRLRFRLLHVWPFLPGGWNLNLDPRAAEQALLTHGAISPAPGFSCSDQNLLMTFYP